MNMVRTMPIVSGMDSSTVYISFATRFRTRPIGVVSKKDIGERITDASIMWCSFLKFIVKNKYMKNNITANRDALIAAHTVIADVSAVPTLLATPNAA